MGIMPHGDIDRALELAMGLDVPFWPQLPRLGVREDMYVQASEHFPGIVLDEVTGRITLDSTRFAGEMAAYSERMLRPDAFRLTPEYSLVYHRFLEMPLDDRPAIRGQQIGPVSFGFKVVDEDRRPIIYNEDIRVILYDFMQRKANVQYRELRQKNERAFVWLDEPGLGWAFSGMTGYDDVRLRADYRAFTEGLEGARALHLCANVNLPYLLDLGIEILSFDAFQLEVMPRHYAVAVADFLRGGGIISWGIVPVSSLGLATESPASLTDRLLGYWSIVADGGDIAVERIAEQALIAPARCMLKDIGLVDATDNGGEKATLSSREEQLVEKAFGWLAEVSHRLRRHLHL